MKSIVTMIVVALAGCRTIESVIEEAGGKPPITCLGTSNLRVCQDAAGHLWACDAGSTKCVAINQAKALLEATERTK